MPPQTRELSSADRRLEHHADPGAGCTVRRMWTKYAHIDFEESEKAIWILIVFTQHDRRNMGHATNLLKALKNYGIKSNRTIYPGALTEDDGQNYLYNTVKSLFGLNGERSKNVAEDETHGAAVIRASQISGDGRVGNQLFYILSDAPPSAGPPIVTGEQMDSLAKQWIDWRKENK